MVSSKRADSIESRVLTEEEEEDTELLLELELELAADVKLDEYELRSETTDDIADDDAIALLVVVTLELLMRLYVELDRVEGVELTLDRVTGVELTVDSTPELRLDSDPEGPFGPEE